MEKNSTINVPLTNELKQFVINQTGDGTMYSTPSEYVRDLIRHQAERVQAKKIRESILQGYQDAIKGRTIEFSGNLRDDMKSLND